MERQTLLVWTAGTLLLGGCLVSHSPWVDAHPEGFAIDATRDVLYSTDLLPNILFGAGTLVAAILVLRLVYDVVRVPDPYRKYRGPPT